MSERIHNLANYSVVILAATAMAGVVETADPSMLSQASAQEARQTTNIYEYCTGIAAKLDGAKFSSSLVTPREVQVTLAAETVDKLDPNCGKETDTERWTSVVVTDDGKVIGKKNNLLKPSNDHGEEISDDIKVDKKVAVGNHLKVTYNTRSVTQDLGHDLGVGMTGHRTLSYPIIAK